MRLCICYYQYDSSIQVNNERDHLQAQPVLYALVNNPMLWPWEFLLKVNLSGFPPSSFHLNQYLPNTIN